MPTDTVYGLCALAAYDEAVTRIYLIKHRAPNEPLPLFVASGAQARQIVEWNAAAEALSTRYWPGSLTLVLRRKDEFETGAAAGSETLGVRMPGDAALRMLAAALGPITGTSANLSGQSECRTAAEVHAQLGEKVECIVDMPVAAGGVASTVVDLSEPGSMRVIREGAIPTVDIEQILAHAASLA
jgi:L-threonylcarbamoyladenylate synthase